MIKKGSLLTNANHGTQGNMVLGFDSSINHASPLRKMVGFRTEHSLGGKPYFSPLSLNIARSRR